MIYMQLKNPIRGFDKIRIKEVSFFDTDGESNKQRALGFRYQLYKDVGGIFSPLYEKHVNVRDEEYINSSMSSNDSNISAYEFICKQLIQYLIDENIEEGTIEKE